MEINFSKYQATGNDFILIDDREGSYDLTLDQVKQLCDRKFGIGSDGLILIRNHSDHDFEMVFYNPDGSQSLCGNGSRCAVNFAKALGLIRNPTSFLAYDGVHEAEILDDEDVRLKMTDVHNVRLSEDGIFIDTGSPHLVMHVEDVQHHDVYRAGKAIRNNEMYKANGINVNFVQLMSQDEIFVRTYERGVENETLSCGTGVTASAIASHERGSQSPVRVKTLGGQLSVTFNKVAAGHYTEVYLIGPAKKVYEGVINI